MDWNPLLATHVVAALVALVIGPMNLLRRRRDRTHRVLGYVWAGAMYYVCLSSFGIVSDGHYSWLHGLSVLTLVTVSLGILAAVRRDRLGHRLYMTGSYLGLLIAFGFAATVPSRSIPRILVDDPGTAWVVGALAIGAVTALYVTVRPRRPTPGIPHMTKSPVA